MKFRPYQRRHSLDNSHHSISGLLPEATEEVTVEPPNSPIDGIDTASVRSNSPGKMQRRNSLPSSIDGVDAAIVPPNCSPGKMQRRKSLPSSFSRSKVKRRGSFTSVVSIGLVAGSSAFGSAGSSSAFQTRVMSRSSSEQSLGSIGHSTSTTKQAQMTRSKNDRAIGALNMLPVDADAVINTASQTADFLGKSPLVDLPTNLLSKISTTEMFASAVFRSLKNDDKAKSELLNDLSHVAGDLMGFVVPNQTVLRAGVVVARIFSIMADYLPDQMIQPEEAVFQACMLGVSTSLLAKSVKPMIDARLKPTLYRDKRAYLSAFEPMGLSWIQFKSLTASAADWVEVAPHEEIRNGNEDGDFIYFVGRGDADLIKGENIIQHGDEYKMLGELDFARKLQERNMQRIKRRASFDRSTFQEECSINNPCSSRVQAGSSGATLLRIETSKLLDLMDHDEQLAESVNGMVFGRMQEKLSSMLMHEPTAIAASS